MLTAIPRASRSPPPRWPPSPSNVTRSMASGTTPSHPTSSRHEAVIPRQILSSFGPVFELHGAEIAQGRAPSGRVVETLDGIEHIRPRHAHPALADQPNRFDLEPTPELATLHRSLPVSSSHPNRVSMKPAIGHPLIYTPSTLTQSRWGIDQRM